jgi:hypothetical protein
MKLAKSPSHLGESIPMLGMLLLACLGTVLLVAYSSSQF